MGLGGFGVHEEVDGFRSARNLPTLLRPVAAIIDSNVPVLKDAICEILEEANPGLCVSHSSFLRSKALSEYGLSIRELDGGEKMTTYDNDGYIKRAKKVTAALRQGTPPDGFIAGESSGS